MWVSPYQPTGMILSLSLSLHHRLVHFSHGIILFYLIAMKESHDSYNNYFIITSNFLIATVFEKHDVTIWFSSVFGLFYHSIAITHSQHNGSVQPFT